MADTLIPIPMATRGKNPAFLFYPKDWLTDAHVRAMSLAATGLYINALAVCWLEGSLPSDPIAMAKVLHRKPVEIRRLWKQIGSCFDLDSNQNWHSPRLEQERTRLRALSARRRAAANSRWKPNGRDAQH